MYFAIKCVDQVLVIWQCGEQFSLRLFPSTSIPLHQIQFQFKSSLIHFCSMCDTFLWCLLPNRCMIWSFKGGDPNENWVFNISSAIPSKWGAKIFWMSITCRCNLNATRQIQMMSLHKQPQQHTKSNCHMPLSLTMFPNE